ncbi:MAG: hypothetical protein ACYTG4_13815, partial [Planctomycetota bacterium]
MRGTTGRTLMSAAACLLMAGVIQAAPLEGPLPGTGGEEDDIQEIVKRITRALRENEQALTRLARGETGEPEKVDIELPENSDGSPPPLPGTTGAGGGEGASGSSGGSTGSSGGEAAAGIGELLRQTGERGSAVSTGIGELLKRVKMRPGPGGQGRPQNQPPGDPKDKKPGNQKKDQEGEKDPLSKKDEPDGGKDPKSPEDSNKEPESGAKPPRSDKEPPNNEKLKGVFFAKLPDKVRRAVENGD